MTKTGFGNTKSKTIASDETQESDGIFTGQSNSCNNAGLTSTYVTKKSVTVTPDVTDNAVIIFYSVTTADPNGGGSAQAKVLEGSNEIIAEKDTGSQTQNNPSVLSSVAILINQPASAKTYDLLVKEAGGVSMNILTATIIGAGVKLA